MSLSTQTVTPRDAPPYDMPGPEGVATAPQHLVHVCRPGHFHPSGKARRTLHLPRVPENVISSLCIITTEDAVLHRWTPTDKTSPLFPRLLTTAVFLETNTQSSGKSHGTPPPNPVKVIFGRPDIGKYLAETFATVSASSTAEVEVDATGRAVARQRDHLDYSQKKSKAVLLKADSKINFKNPAKNKNNKPVSLRLPPCVIF